MPSYETVRQAIITQKERKAIVILNKFYGDMQDNKISVSPASKQRILEYIVEVNKALAGYQEGVSQRKFMPVMHIAR